MKIEPCYLCKEKVEKKYSKEKLYRKVKDQCLFTEKNRGSVYSICN